MKKKFLTLLLASAMAASLLVGCGTTDRDKGQNEQNTQNTQSTELASEEGTSESESQTDDDQAAAEQLLVDLTGSYQELWSVILDEKYQDLWLDNCKALVGEDNAQAAYDKLASMVSGEIYGEEAVKAYADGGGAYDCHFTQGVVTLEFDGATSTIKGYDAYWLGSGISTAYDQTMIENCIKLFCEENLSE